jgi:LysM repeat protein
MDIKQLREWNPWIGPDCMEGLFGNLADPSERAVCVANNASAPTMTASIGPSAILSTTSTGPTQAGVAQGCAKYHTAQKGDSCASINAKSAITFAALHEWNPARKFLVHEEAYLHDANVRSPVGPNCENLWIGYAYCVLAPALKTSKDAAFVREGTASGCKRYHTVEMSDTCQTIQKQFRVSLENLYKWNTGVGANCEALWPEYSLCIAGGP